MSWSDGPRQNLADLRAGWNSHIPEPDEDDEPESDYEGSIEVVPTLTGTPLPDDPDERTAVEAWLDD